MFLLSLAGYQIYVYIAQYPALLLGSITVIAPFSIKFNLK